MDELEISGKRYISSRRAAKENKYHSDYIGQLIRAGKILGTKVGRAWYVEVDSLAAYLGSEAAPYTPSDNKVDIVAPVAPAVTHLHIQPEREPAFDSAEDSESVSGSKKDEDEDEPDPILHPRPLQAYPTLRYVSEDQPFFKPAAAREMPHSTPRMIPPRPAHPAPSRARSAGALALVGVLAIAGFGGVFVLSLFLNYTVSVKGDSTQASIGFALQKLGN